MGAVAQFRVMGGVVGLAIVATVLNGYVRAHLTQFLSKGEVDSLLQSAGTVATFTTEVQALIKDVFAKGYNLQMKILAGFAAAQIPSSMLMWQKKQIRV
jgi:MFS-type transporter involved in bile tolerance (Atg22 family)